MRLHCPHCRAIDWSRDGFRMTSDVSGQLNRIRVSSSSRVAAELPWTCDGCGFQAAPDADLGRQLTEMQVAHLE
jgi:RNase P subunit RPR2